jgi:hypothetical protein
MAAGLSLRPSQSALFTAAGRIDGVIFIFGIL